MHLAKLLRSGGNLLLLDEPTNDLDVDTLRALEDALLGFPGCAVVISHDRWFLDRIATHVLAFEGDSQVAWFEGNFEAYEEHRRALPRRRGRPPAPHHLQAPRAVAEQATPLRAGDTAVRRDAPRWWASTAPPPPSFQADVVPGWRAGRGPHGGYLAAMLLRALTETVADLTGRRAR